MELMMSHLHDGPALAARGVDAAEVTFLVRGSVSAAAGPGGLTEIQPFETTDLDASEGGTLMTFQLRTLGRLYCALGEERRAWRQRIHA
jgi:hypothetical protein